MLYAIDVQGLGLKRCRKVVQAEKAPNGTSIGTSNGTSGTMVGVFQRIFQRILEIKLVLPEQNDKLVAKNGAAEDAPRGVFNYRKTVVRRCF